MSATGTAAPKLGASRSQPVTVPAVRARKGSGEPLVMITAYDGPGATAVKLEGGRKRVRMIEAIIDSEIPVMGHLGLTPQSVHALGGFKVQGKQAGAVDELLADAAALVDAGCFAIVLEAVPDEVGR